MNLVLNRFVVFILILLAASCRKAPQPIAEEQEKITEGRTNATPKGMYLLNEANMNSNKASLDYLDFTTGVYRRNIYGQANPSITKGLGDVGNDLLIYGSKLYVVVNVSNKIEVLDAVTAKKIAQVNLLNCRYVTAFNGKIYASAYLGQVGNPKAPNGVVAEIDTATYQITRKVEVGRQPEELAVVNQKLYVANSGGYSPPNYERTISVIDIPTFTISHTIDVAINLHRLKADKYGDLYVTSRGDYYDNPSKLFVIDTQTDKIKKSFDLAVSDLVISGDYAYLYSTSWNYLQGKNTISYHILNVATETIEPGKFISDGTDNDIQVPYGIIRNPQTEDIFVTDAKNYVTPGSLYCYDKNGTLKWKVTTGDIPAHFAFSY